MKTKSRKILKGLIQLVLFVVLVGGGVTGFVALKNAKPPVQTREHPKVLPVVRCETVEPQSRNMQIEAQGTVSAVHQTNLASQVAGKVIAVSPSVVNGGAFSRGDILVRIDPADYKLAVTLAEASIKDSESRLLQLEEEALVARKEWRLHMNGSSKSGAAPPPLVAKEPQLAAARAKLEADQASLAKAALNLKRTKIVAPFAGRVSQKMVDLGQYVSPGQTLASVYATSAVEISLPMDPEDLYWIHVPGFTPGEGPGARATVKARLAGLDLAWEGSVVRSEGVVNTSTRLINVVVRVKNPFGKNPPLSPGLFVTVELEGRLLENVFVIPRAALRQDNQVWLMDGAGKMEFRNIRVARIFRDTVWIQEGLSNGEAVVVSNLKTPVEGMRVRLAEAQ